MSDGTFISLVVDLKRGDRSGGEMEPHFFFVLLFCSFPASSRPTNEATPGKKKKINIRRRSAGVIEPVRNQNVDM